MNRFTKKLFVGAAKTASKPARVMQYYLNKDAFDKKTSVEGIYELSDIPYVKGQKAPRRYRPKKAAVGKGRDHLLDIESPTPLTGRRPKKLPVIVSVHGGGYVTNNKECNRPHCQYLASKGYKVVNVNYTLQPEAEMVGELCDLRDVFKFMEKNAKKYGFDTDNVFLIGDSSGGHLVLLYTALQNSAALQEKLGVKVPAVQSKATAATCPVGSFVADDMVSKIFKNLAGRLYDDEMKSTLSYEGFIGADYPEVLIVTTEADSAIYPTTKGIHEHLDKVGVKHGYRVIEARENKLGHVFNILHPEWPESIEANQAILDFFENKKD